MRLLIATGVYPPESGGPATYTKLLEERLPALGFDVSVLPFRRVRHLPKVARHIAYFWRCFRMAQHADFVLAQDTVSVGLPSALAALLAGKKFLVRIPGDYAWEQGSQRFGATVPIDEFQEKYFGVRVALLRAVQKFVVRRAVRVIAPSEYLRTLAIAWGAAPARAVLNYNGVALPVPHSAPAQKPEGFVLVSVGRLVPWKGMDGIIRAVGSEPSWSAVIVDEGPEEGALRTLADEVGGGRITFTGRLDRAHALGWVSAADVFVLNSSYEGLSHLLIEAMSLGVPIVATNIGGNPELITDGVHGLLIPPHDDEALRRALKKLQQDPAFAKQLGTQAALRAEDFSIEFTLDRLCALLKTL